MWKKKIAVFMAAAMITGMSGLTVFAEEQQAGGAPQMEQQAPASQTPQGEAPAGMEGQAPQGEAPAGQLPQGEAPAGMESQAPQGEAPAGQPPQMGQQGEAPQNGQQSPQGEMPQAPEGEAPADMRQAPQGEAPHNGQQTPQGEAPANNEQKLSQGEDSQPSQGEAPSDSGQQSPQIEGLFEEGQSFQNSAPMGGGNRQAPGKMDHRGPFIDFEACVKDGTISQETYDAIKKYMDENKPERPTTGENSEAKEGEKQEDGTSTEMKEEAGEKPDLLKDLLDAEVIKQDEYDALVKRSAEEKAADTKDKATVAQEDKAADVKADETA